MGDYLVNHDGTCDYGDIGDPTEIEAYKVPVKYNANRKYRGKEQRTFKQFRGKMKGVGRKSDFRKRTRISENQAIETKFGGATGPFSASRMFKSEGRFRPKKTWLGPSGK